MQFFQKNIKLLQNSNPRLSQRLLSVETVSEFEIFMDDNDVRTLNFVHTKHFTPMYEGSPLQTIQDQIDEYKVFAKYPYLYMYGIGNGVLLKELLSNEKHQRILVIEPEIELLYVVLHMLDFSKEIDSGRLVLLGYEDIDFPTLVGYFLKYKEHKYAKAYDLHINASYYDKNFSQHLQHTNRIIIEAMSHSVNIAGNSTVDSLIGLKHHIGNLAKVLETPPLFELLKKLHTCDTAVLVSTGPSLTKQLPLLKKIAPYVRIVAVDASFPVLHKAGIKPDVVVSIERVKESARFFTEMPKEAFKDIVFALSSVQHREVVSSIKGGTTQISLRPLDLMMYTGPEHWGYIGLGQSAANMAYELIYHAEFKNCILIGQDLAYGADGKSHASGHVFGQENVKTKESDTWVEGWQGKEKVRTNHVWDMFRKSFEKDIGDTKARMLTVNATEGGVSIYGTLEIAFSDAIEKYATRKNKKITLELLRATSSEKERITKETWAKVDAMKEYVAKLLDESKSVFLEVASACEQESESIEDEALVSLVNRIEAIKERYSEEIFEKVVWHIAQTTMLSKEIELAPIEVFIAKNEEQERERLLHLVQAHKPWLFLFSGILDAILRTIEYAKVRQLIDEVETIEVCIGEKKIDSFRCHEFQAKEGRVFDIDMRGILYDVPDVYQEKIDDVVFKDAQNAKELPKEFVSVFSRDDEKYNELSFLRSLEEPIDEERIKDLYMKDCIGFLAVEENLEDEDFVNYIKELYVRFPQVTFKAFYFSDKQKKMAESVFCGEIDKFEVFSTSDIYILCKNIEIFILSNKASNYIEVVNFLQTYLNNILAFNYHSALKGRTVRSFGDESSTIYFTNPEKFYFTLEEYKLSDKNVTKLLFNNHYKKYNQQKILQDEEDTYSIWYFDRVEMALNSSEIKLDMIKNLRY